MSEILSGLNEFVNQFIAIARLLKDVLINEVGFFNWLPNSISFIFLNLLTIVVAYKILGREG